MKVEQNNNWNVDHKQLHKNLEENGSIKITLLLNLPVYKKLKEFTQKTHGKYQSLINEILKENVDSYLAKQIAIISEEMHVLGKKYKIG